MSEPGPASSEGDEPAALPQMTEVLLPANAMDWLKVFGPGAVIASLTIGAGELIFSARAGALFGYRLLWFFSLVLLLKWVLVFSAARHIVLSGAHPFQRWLELPGPRGWFPLVFFLLALMAFPIWVSFHAGTVGTLLSWLAGTERSLRGLAHYVWGMGILGMVLILVFTGGYARLERVQLWIVLLMLAAVVASLFLLKPDWSDLLRGLLVPESLAYPNWVSQFPEIAERPVWVETVTYVGIIGGSGYDYLAYVSYLREKQWGQAGRGVANAAELKSVAADAGCAQRRWVRAPLIDCTLSFLAVLIFAAVFVACGALVLGAQQKVPSGANLLMLQAEFVSPIYPGLKWIYFVGAFLAMFGTLYGTIEVAPTVLREMMAAVRPDPGQRAQPQLRRRAILWVGLGGLIILAGNFLSGLWSEGKSSPSLIAMLTPANLFTGVLACGLICLLNVWADSRFLPAALRMSWPLKFLNVFAGVVFLLLGLKGCWDDNGWVSLGILAGTVALGWVAAWAGQGAFRRVRD